MYNYYQIPVAQRRRNLIEYARNREEGTKFSYTSYLNDVYGVSDSARK